MSKIERVTVALPAEALETARAAVESGEYASTGEVVRDALRLWEHHRALQAQEIARLRVIKVTDRIVTARVIGLKTAALVKGLPVRVARKAP